MGRGKACDQAAGAGEHTTWCVSSSRDFLWPGFCPIPSSLLCIHLMRDHRATWEALPGNSVHFMLPETDRHNSEASETPEGWIGHVWCSGGAGHAMTQLALLLQWGPAGCCAGRWLPHCAASEPAVHFRRPGCSHACWGLCKSSPSALPDLDMCSDTFKLFCCLKGTLHRWWCTQVALQSSFRIVDRHPGLPTPGIFHHSTHTCISPVEMRYMLTVVLLMAVLLLLNYINWACNNALLSARMYPHQCFSQHCEQQEGEVMVVEAYSHSWHCCAGNTSGLCVSEFHRTGIYLLCSTFISLQEHQEFQDEEWLWFRQLI